MSKIKKISTRAPWKDIVGYSRALKIGNTIEVSNTTALGATEGIAKAYAEAFYTITPVYHNGRSCQTDNPRNSSGDRIFNNYPILIFKF